MAADLLDIEIVNFLVNSSQSCPERPIGQFSYDKRLFDLYNSTEFYQRFRMRKTTAMKLLQIVAPKLQPNNNRGQPTCVLKQLLVTLRMYGSRMFQKDDGDLFDLSQPTISRIVKKVTIVIACEFNYFIRFPENEHALKEFKEGFYSIGRFPNVIGAIDGTHIPVKVNGEEIERYRNRKNMITINVQAICDHRMRFTNLVARWPGSVHDSRIFHNSEIYSRLENDQFDGWLLGDAGYACKKYMLTPLQNPITRPERAYNYSHAKTRNIIERTFGAWKRKFPILKAGMQTKLSTSLRIITACGVIWNLIRQENEDIENEEDENEEPDNSIYSNESDSVGFTIRKSLIQNYFTSLTND